MLRALLTSSAVLLLTLPGWAEAPRDAVTLSYLPSRTAAPLCLGADFFALEVQIRLGYALFQPSAPNHLTLKVERLHNGMFRATGEMRDEAGEVTFTRDYIDIDCTAVLVSMAISVAVVFTKIPEAPEPIPPSPPVVSCPPAPEPTPPPPQPALPPEPYRLQVGLASVFSIGTAPTVVGGLDWFVGVRRENVEVAIEGRALLAPSAEVEIFRRREGYQYLYAAVSGSGCYHHAWAFGCARIEVGSLSLKNPAVDIRASEIGRLGAGLRIGGEKRLMPGLAIRVYADIFGQAFKTAFYQVNGHLIDWESPRISAAIGIGPVLFWDK